MAKMHQIKTLTISRYFLYLSMSMQTNLSPRPSPPFRLIRAVVADVNIDPETGIKTIYLNEFGCMPEPPYFEADPPSPITIEGTGSGMQNIPAPGVHCLAYIPQIGNKQFERGQIITYLPTTGTPPEGSLSAEKLEAGSFYIKIGGRAKTKFQMTKDGRMSLGGGNFARMEINSQLMAMYFSTKRYRRKNSVGLYENMYQEFDIQQPLLLERTSHYSSFGVLPESPTESDAKLQTEEVALVPNIRPFVNKATVRAGKIHNPRQTTDDLATHTYEVDTRNSTGGVPTQKDAVTKLELGFQGGHYPDKNLAFRSAGNLIHWTAKRNIAGNVGTYLSRYGMLEGDHGTKAYLAPAASVIPAEFVKGEIYRHQVLQGLQLNIPLGIPVIDPLGEGLGYSLSDAETSQQAYITSEGKLNSPLLMASQNTYGGPFQQFDSVYRRHIHDISVPGTGLFVDEQYGGAGLLPTDPDYYQRTIEQQAAMIPQATMMERFGQTTADAGTTYKIDITDISMNAHSLWMSPMLSKFESAFGAPAGHYGALTYDHTAMVTTLTDGVGPTNSSYMDFSTAAGININAVTGATTVEMTPTALNMQTGFNVNSITMDSVAGETVLDVGTGATSGTFNALAGINLNAVSGGSTLDMTGVSAALASSLNNVTMDASGVTITNGLNSIVVDAAGVTITAGTATLEITTSGGVKANGLSLVNANLIPWLQSGIGMIAVGGMGPSAMSPAMAAQLSAMGSLPGHFVPMSFISGT